MKKEIEKLEYDMYLRGYPDNGISMTKLNELIDRVNELYQAKKKEEVTEQFTKEELENIRSTLADDIVEIPFTEGFRSKLKVILSKIERMLK